MTVAAQQIRFSATHNCIIATAVWGKHYVDIFSNIALPNLLSAGNIPAMANILSCEYVIYTHDDDIADFKRHQSIEHLKSIMPVRFVNLGKPGISSAIVTQAKIFQNAMRSAIKRRAALCYCMPDAVWSDGSYQYIAASLAAGHTAIMQPTVRVVSETLLPELHKLAAGSTVLKLSTDDIVLYAQSHLHPLTSCYHRDSTRYPHHAELILTPSDGSLAMTYHFRDPKVLVPAKIHLTSRLLVDAKEPYEKIDSAADTKKIFGLSLTPLIHDSSWYRKKIPFSHEDASRSWLDFDSPHNDICAREVLPLNIAKPPADSARRKTALRIQQRAVLLTSARGFNALIRVLPTHHCKIVAQFLAGALHWGRGHRHILARYPITVIVPSDAAFSDDPSAIFEMLRPGNETTLVGYLRAHIFRTPLPQDGQALSQVGNAVAIENSGSRILINGSPAVNCGEIFRGISILIINKPIVSLKT